MNLTQVSYWSTQSPFIDRFKTSNIWYATDTSYQRMTEPVALDKDGNPLGLPDGALNISVQIGVDPLSLPMTDRYELTYEGTAAIRISGGKVISSTAGKVVFELTDPVNNFVTLSVSALDGNNPLHDIHVVREDQVGLFNAGQIFNPDFLEKVSQWDTLRFMDWGHTNASQPATWDNRTTIDSASWASQNSASGVPIEVMVALANQAHVNMWLNIPTDATDDFVRNQLAYVKDHLDPGLTVSVEYSNEVWNWGFPAAKYAQDMANQLWGKDVNGDGIIDPSNAAESVAGGWVQYYGYRSAQIASIAHSVFGSDSDGRLIDVLATQTGYFSLSNYIFQGVARAGAGNAWALFGDYAITTYFGNALSMAASNPKDAAIVLGWAKSGDAGITAALHELQYGGALSYDDSLSASMKTWAAEAAIARQNGLNLVAYEGGAHLTAAGYATADQALVIEFFGKLMNDPRMGDLYAGMVANFTAVGGTELTAFADAGLNSKYGYWGILDNIYQDSSPRYDALVAAAHASESDGTASQHIIGTSGDDTLYGGAGADRLDGGPGADTMAGGDGNDIYIVDNIGDTVIETAGGGIDEIRTTLAALTLADNVEILRYMGTGKFTGHGNALDNMLFGGDGGNALYGEDGNDALLGGAGNDWLDGGAGADKMSGGAGDDTYVVDNIGDVVVEQPNAGHDTVRTSLAIYTLGQNIEDLTFIGTGPFQGWGNALDNRITGGDGNDYLVGGAGIDTLIGGLGNDAYNVDNVRDIVVELPDEGYDTIYASVGYTLPANVEKLGLMGTEDLFAYGNDLANNLTGNSGNNLLEGLGGDDTLYGLDGNDTLYGGAGRDTLYGGNGADIFAFAPGDSSPILSQADMIRDFSHAEGDKIDLSLMGGLTFIADAPFDRTGGQVRVTGSGNAWVVSGDTNGDGITDFSIAVTSATALVASDFILDSSMQTQLGSGSGQTPGTPGGEGASGSTDTGNIGTETPPVDSGSDGAILPPPSAPIEIQTYLSSLQLGEGEANLTALGSKSFEGIGNALDNVMTAGSGYAVLSGKDGNDTLIGGPRGNRLDGGAGDDTLHGGAGQDMLIGGDGADSLYGGGGKDLLYGGSGDDRLDGGMGQDMLHGGAGADTFIFMPGGTDAKASKADTILDFSHAEGDKIDLSALDAITGGADNAFSFIGSAAFTRHAGELRFAGSGQDWTVMGDTNGDGKADFMINVHSMTALQANDFIL